MGGLKELSLAGVGKFGRATPRTAPTAPWGPHDLAVSRQRQRESNLQSNRSVASFGLPAGNSFFDGIGSSLVLLSTK